MFWGVLLPANRINCFEQLCSLFLKNWQHSYNKRKLLLTKKLCKSMKKVEVNVFLSVFQWWSLMTWTWDSRIGLETHLKTNFCKYQVLKVSGLVSVLRATGLGPKPVALRLSLLHWCGWVKVLWFNVFFCMLYLQVMKKQNR